MQRGCVGLTLDVAIVFRANLPSCSCFLCVLIPCFLCPRHYFFGMVNAYYFASYTGGSRDSVRIYLGLFVIAR